MNLLGSFERMQKHQPYRKYRPEVALKGNAKEWWGYCIAGVLEVDVRRYSRMWRWENIRQHRNTCRQYRESYKEKLLQKTPGQELITRLEEMEKVLNVVSITIFRQLAEMEAA